MTRKRMAVFATVIMLLTFLVTSILMEVSAQQEMVPEWTYEDEGWFTRVAVSADGSYVGAGTNNTNKFYLFRDGVLLWNYSVGSVHSVSMSSGGKYVAVGAGSDFYLFDRDDSSSPLLEYPVGYESSIVSLSSDGKYVFVGTLNGIFVYEYLNNELKLKNQYTTNSPVIFDVACSSDGEYVVALGKSGLSGNERYRVYFFVMGNVVNPWIWSDLVVVGVIVAVIIGDVGFIFYRSSRRVYVRAF